MAAIHAGVRATLDALTIAISTPADKLDVMFALVELLLPPIITSLSVITPAPDAIGVPPCNPSTY